MKIGIVGCGIAGGYLAYKLSKKHDVTVFEHKRRIGKRACSGIVSERLWDFIPKNDKLVRHKIRRIIIHFPKKDIELIMDPVMLVLDHDKLDRYVASLSKAKILLNKHVSKIYQEGGKQIVIASQKKYAFDYVIGADGPMSIVRKSISRSVPKFSLGVFIYSKEPGRSDTVETWPLKDGFAWRIPRKDKVEYGVMENPNIAVAVFKRFFKKRGEVYSALIPQGLITAYTDRVAVVGDAAGLTKPWSGGGIIWSLQSADMLVRNFPEFRKYNEELRKFFEPKIFFSKRASKLGVFMGRHLPWIVPKKILFDSDWMF